MRQESLSIQGSLNFSKGYLIDIWLDPLSIVFQLYFASYFNYIWNVYIYLKSSFIDNFYT